MHDHCAYIPYVLLRASHPTESNRNESQRRPFFENLSFNFLTILSAAMESICSRKNAGHVEKRRYYRRRTRVKQSVGNFLAILRGITRPGQRTHGLRAIVIGYVSSCSFLVFQRNVTVLLGTRIRSGESFSKNVAARCTSIARAFSGIYASESILLVFISHPRSFQRWLDRICRSLCYQL